MLRATHIGHLISDPLKNLILVEMRFKGSPVAPFLAPLCYEHFHVEYLGARQAGKRTTIRRTAVRETGITRHNGDPIEGPSGPSKHYRIEEFKGGPINWTFNNV